MATTDVQTALANEARRQELKQRIASTQGAMNATASAVARLNSINSDGAVTLALAQAELIALDQGAGPGITADFGPKSSVTQLIEMERFAAKDACIAFVKANPACDEVDAAAAWNAAALASHPAFASVIQDGMVMSALYRANLVSAGLIGANSWEAHRQFILNTDAPTLESL